MNKNLLISAWVIMLGGEEIILQLIKQLVLISVSNPSQEAMQVWSMVLMIIQLLLMLYVVIASLLALKDKGLRVLAWISGITGGLKLAFAVLALIIGFFSKSPAA